MAIFLQLFFMSNEESIYFLCILGDCILKKNNNLFYFIKPNTKHFISAIDYIIYTTLGYSISNNFGFVSSCNIYIFKLFISSFISSIYNFSKLLAPASWSST